MALLLSTLVILCKWADKKINMALYLDATFYHPVYEGNRLKVIIFYQLPYAVILKAGDMRLSKPHTVWI